MPVDLCRAALPRLAVAAIALGALAPAPVAEARRAVDVLPAVFGLPAHVVTRFPRDAVFAATKAGEYVVLDRRGHGLYVFDASGAAVRRIAETGPGPGELFNPMAMAIGTNDIIAIADVPAGFDRIQYFNASGLRIGGFYLPVGAEPRLTIADLLIANGDSLGFNGTTFLVNRPDWGSLVAELDVMGQVVRNVGLPRRTGHTPDRDLDIAMNIGIPVPDPTGGFYFVFQTGVPLVRKYDAGGRLLFERHIEGPELDARIQTLPTTWATRLAGTRPVVPPLVRSAALDPSGRLWISLIVPYTYVYDRTGTQVRTVQFRGAGIMSPSSLFFTPAGRLLVGPGGYEFDVNGRPVAGATGGSSGRIESRQLYW